MKTEAGLRILKSKLLNTIHGFSTVHGGVSPAPFASLNLGGSEDAPENIAQNRRIFLTALGVDPMSVAWMKQVHGADVLFAKPGEQTCDGLVSNVPGLTLAVSTADCYPLLLHDAVNGVIGAAHAGWRGTLARIAGETVQRMLELGAKKENIVAVIGPGICGSNYEVSEDVITQFEQAGFPKYIAAGRMLDLIAANTFVLQESGIQFTNIDVIQRCSTEVDFFSFRRDNGKTGRMWSVIALH